MSNRRSPSRRHLWPWVLLACGLNGLALPAMAQVSRILPDQRPSDERLPPPLLDDLTRPGVAPILPPFRIPEDAEVDGSSPDQHVEVHKIEISGNTVVPSEVLQAIAQPYEGRRLSHTEIQKLRDRLTLVYIERGYATSGAILPSQRIKNGVLQVRIIEGKLDDIRVEVDGRFRPGYFRRRIAHSQQGVLDVPRLQEQLQLFQQDPQIESIQARLEATATRGVSRLILSVREAPFYSLGADFDNYRSPAIGSLGGTANAGVKNLIGVGDAFWARFTGSEGLRQVGAGFEVPFTVWDTRFGVRYQYSEGDVVDGLFESLGIESEATSVGFTLSQPLYRSLRSNIGVRLHADWRRAQSFLFDGAIGLPTRFDEDGESQEFVLRLGFDASYRTRSQSLQIRSLLSYGIDALGATVNSGSVPDGRFFSWLGQFQWAIRLPWLDAQILNRFDVQLSPDPLLPLEQYAIGGRYTVRGYRENTLVRDNGLNGSVEVRVPVFEQSEPRVLIELAPFAELGRSWNNNRGDGALATDPELIASVGMGVRVHLPHQIYGELYWGHRLKEFEDLGDSDLQDDGIAFRLGIEWP